jgi:hypothetical protein
MKTKKVLGFLPRPMDVSPGARRKAYYLALSPVILVAFAFCWLVAIVEGVQDAAALLAEYLRDEADGCSAVWRSIVEQFLERPNEPRHGD